MIWFPLHFTKTIFISVLMLLFFSNAKSILANEVDGKHVYYYQHFNVKDGLPSSQVYSVFQDSLGYIWMTTDRGIVRYDGENFKTYTKEDGLIDVVNFDIIPENGTKFWLSNFMGDLSYWDGKKFNQFKYNQKLKEVFKEGKENFNVLYVNDSIVVLSPLAIAFSLADGKTVHIIVVDRKTGEINFKNKVDIPYIDILNKPKSINFLRISGSSIQKELIEKIQSIFPNDILIYLSEMGEKVKKYSVTSSQGAYIFDEANLKSYESFFLKTKMNAVYQDNNNGIWFTTYGNGVYYFPSFGVKKVQIKESSPNQGFDFFYDFDNFLLAKGEDSYIYAFDSLHNHKSVYERDVLFRAYPCKNRENCFNTGLTKIQKTGSGIRFVNTDDRSKRYAYVNLSQGDTAFFTGSSVAVKSKSSSTTFKVPLGRYHVIKKGNKNQIFMGTKFGLFSIRKKMEFIRKMKFLY